MHSTSITIGRGRWWGVQFLCVVGMAVFFTLLFCIVPVIEKASGGHMAARSEAYLVPIIKWAEGTNVLILEALAIGLGIGCLWSAWSSLVADAKRWSDLGMSRGWVTLRFIPILSQFFFPPLLFGIIIAVIGFVLVIFLGCLPGVGADAPQTQPAKGRFNKPQVIQTPAKKNSGGLLMLGILFLLATGIAGAFQYGLISAPAGTTFAILSNLSSALAKPQATTPEPSPASDNVSLDPVSTDSIPAASPPALLGTTDTNFAKDWVFADDEKLTGITAVTPAHHSQVSILYSTGRKTVPAYTLPQGFLAAWDITRDQLKEFDLPPPPPENP